MRETTIIELILEVALFLSMFLAPLALILGYNNNNYLFISGLLLYSSILYIVLIDFYYNECNISCNLIVRFLG